MGKKERLQFVDIAKGIGIILVVYGHVARGVFNAGIPMDASLFRLVDSVIYSFHMPLFFFMSGLFVLQSLERKGGRRFVLNKFDLILYPYVIWSVIQGGFEVVMSSYTTFNVTVSDVLSFPWDPRVQFWYLYALFFIMCMSALVYRIRSNTGIVLISVVFSVLYVLNHQGVIDGQMFGPAGRIAGFILGYTVFLTWGVLVGRYGLQIFETSRLTLVVALGAFILSQFVFHSVLGLRFDDRGFYYLVNSAVSICFVMLLSYHLGTLGSRWLAYVGASSMVIFVMHILAGSGIRIALARFLGVDDATVHLVVGTVAGTLLPLVFVQVLGKARTDFLFSAPRLIALDRH